MDSTILNELSVVADESHEAKPHMHHFNFYLNNIKRHMKSRRSELPNSILMTAICDLPINEKTYAILHYIIEQKSINLDTRAADGTTSLMKACQKNVQPEFIFKLIQAGANIFLNDNMGYSALHHAAENNHTIVIKKLLEFGAKIDSVTMNKKTALHLACAKNALDAIQTLIYHGAKVYPAQSHCYSETTPFEDALIFGFPAAAVMVIEKSGYFPPQLFRQVMCRLLKQPHQVFRTMLIQELRVKLFGLLWNTNPKMLEKSSEPLIKIFLCESDFKSSDWVNCLKIMLKSEVAPQLMKEYVGYANCHPELNTNLMVQFIKVNGKSYNLRELTQLWLHLDGPVCYSDIIHGLSRYGFCKEIESLILAAGPDILKRFRQNKNKGNYVARILCGLECEIDYTMIFYILENYSRLDKMCEFVLKFFTLPKWLKPKIETYKNQNLLETYNKNGSFIPLHELSRNVIMKTVRKNLTIQRPRDYYSAIDTIQVPERIIKYIKLIKPWKDQRKPDKDQ